MASTPRPPARTRARRPATRLALVLLAALLATAPAAAAATLRISQRNEPGDLDPAAATLVDDFFLIRALGEGLVRPDPEGGVPLPAAAERWDVAPDGHTYTFHLRPGARWSNGEPVTAPDFLESYRRVLTPATAAPKAELFFLVRNARAFVRGDLADFAQVGFAAPDALTLVVTLENPYPEFLRYAASGPWIPVNPRVVSRLGRAWTRPGHHVGNGPFTLAEWRPHQRIVVKKNPAFHAAATIGVDEIQFLAFDNGDSEERAFRAGNVDITMSVPATKVATYRRDHPDELHHAPLAETRYLAFNANRPPLDDLRVRQALALAIDREKIVERLLPGGPQAAGHFLPPVLFPDEAAEAGARAHDPARAARLLADAGYPGGRDFPRLELTAWSRGQLATLEAIQEMWRQTLGLTVGLVVQEAKVEQNALRTGTYDIAFWPAIPDVADPVQLLAPLRSDSPENYSHWSNATFDALLQSLLTQPAGPARTRLLAAANHLLAAAVPVTPVYANAQLWLMRPEVHGWSADALWTRTYVGLSLGLP